jgi:penicillin-binding protein 1A
VGATALPAQQETAWRQLRRRIDRVLGSRRALAASLDATWRAASAEPPALQSAELLRLAVLDMLSGVAHDRLLQALNDHLELRRFVGVRRRRLAKLGEADLHALDRWLALDEAALLLGGAVLAEAPVRRALESVRAGGGWLGWSDVEAAALRRRAEALLEQPAHSRWRRRSLWSRLGGGRRSPKQAAADDATATAPDVPPRRRGRRARWLGLLLVGAIVLAFGLIDARLPMIGEMRQIIGRPTIEIAVGADGRPAIVDAVFPVPVPLKSLPDDLVTMLVEKEDHRFWYHPGFDPVGIARALLGQADSGFTGASPQGGGSTITQQVSRMVFLDQDRTLARKLREIVLATKLELLLDKHDILELYLNRAHFGRQLYGIEQAARYYFGVNARDLNRYQAAMLVGMLPAPARLNPQDHIEAAHAVARRVLDLMVARGKLAAGERDKALRRWAGRPLAELRTGGKSVPLIEHRWFSDWIDEEVAGLGLKPGQQVRLVLTLDPLAQIYAQLAAGRIVAAGRSHRASEVAIVVMSPEGAVRAMVGSSIFAANQNNYAVSAHRAAASTFKLFVYLAALEQGMAPDDMISDEPIMVAGRAYPRNFDGRYHGPVKIVDALANSFNAATVQVAETVGLDKVRAVAQRLGIASPLPEGPSLALGAGGVTPLELTAAYAVLPNGGYLPDPHGLIAAQRADGAILWWRREPEARLRVLDAAQIKLMNAMLREVVRRGTGAGAAFALPVVGKTGTSQDSRDAWFVGYTGDLVATIWAGRADNAPMRSVSAGAFLAEPWGNLMSNIYDERPLPALAGVEH